VRIKADGVAYCGISSSYEPGAISESVTSKIPSADARQISVWVSAQCKVPAETICEMISVERIQLGSCRNVMVETATCRT